MTQAHFYFPSVKSLYIHSRLNDQSVHHDHSSSGGVAAPVLAVCCDVIPLPPPQPSLPNLGWPRQPQSSRWPGPELAWSLVTSTRGQPSLATPASTSGEVVPGARVWPGLVVVRSRAGRGAGLGAVMVMVTGYIDCWRQATACSLANLCPAVHTGLRLGGRAEVHGWKLVLNHNIAVSNQFLSTKENLFIIVYRL